MLWSKYHFLLTYYLLSTCSLSSFPQNHLLPIQHGHIYYILLQTHYYKNKQTKTEKKYILQRWPHLEECLKPYLPWLAWAAEAVAYLEASHKIFLQYLGCSEAQSKCLLRTYILQVPSMVSFPLKIYDGVEGALQWILGKIWMCIKYSYLQGT